MASSALRGAFKPSREPPPLPPRKKPIPTEVRQSGCTHQKMTRLFDEYGAGICSVCQKHPSMGWLYRCTQDSQGLLPKSDFSNDSPTNTRVSMRDPVLRHLSPSVIKAIHRGQYTDNQIQELIRQKDSVRQAIQGDETRPTTSSSSTAGSTTFSALPESTTFSTHTSASLDEELRVAYDWTSLSHAWQAEIVKEPEPELSMPIIAACTFKICATCRPTYRERATQNIDEVLRDLKWPPRWELENKRISDLNIVKTLGLKQPHRFYAYAESGAVDSNNTSLSFYPSSNDEAHIEDGSEGYAHNKRHSRSGFRETVRNALKRAHSDVPILVDNNDSSPSTSNSSTESLPHQRRSMIFFRRKSRQALPFSSSAGATVVGNDALQNSLNLMLASNTPLPRSEPSTPMYPPTQFSSGSHKKENKPNVTSGLANETAKEQGIMTQI